MSLLRMKPVALAVAGALIAVGVGADQATKVWALNRLTRGSIDVIDGALTMQYAENRNFAFGLGESLPVWLRLGVVVALTLVLVGLLLHSADLGSQLGFGMAIAGSIGNIIDRVRLGFVVDFIYWHGGFRWPNFNVADMLVVCGVGVLFVFAPKQKAQSSPKAQDGARP